MPAQATAATKAARASYHHLAGTLRELEADLRWGLEDSVRIPPEWSEIALAEAVPFKVPVTLRVDADVAKFFRAMGRGHLTRMNAVLRAFMQARLAGVVKGAEEKVYALNEGEIYAYGVKEVMEMLMAFNARGAAGLATAEENVEIEKRIIALRLMQEKLGLPEELRMF